MLPHRFYSSTLVDKEPMFLYWSNLKFHKLGIKSMEFSVDLYIAIL